MRLEGKTAVVTGAGSGIGKSIAEVFAAEGARVALLDIRGETAEAAASGLPGEGHVALATDVADSASVASAFAEVDAAFGRVDVLINNAGVDRTPGDGFEQAMKGELQLLHMSDDSFRRMFAINVDGVFFGSREAVVEAVVLRRMEPLQRRRRELLDSLLATEAPRSVESLLGVLVLPLAELLERKPRAGRAYMRLLSRLYSDRKLVAYELAMRYFGEVHRELGRELVRAIPDVPPAVLTRRIAVCVQTSLAMLADPEPYESSHEADVPSASPEAVARELVEFMAGGLRAGAEAENRQDVSSTA